MRGTNSFKASLTLNFISEQSCVRKEQRAKSSHSNSLTEFYWLLNSETEVD